ncbi:leucyl/phenylalanyl-tRNA--protein transferase [Ideonella livida]|uniref:Leucyl/phenylalanyl-tRNA--protein transferase n=1 Tax=Ideonella livida TaxID=2707176 RepID=A0A7C9PGB9_9BURK|nr:leucyl/phenylalanyl-tRNA--protein transferase [Ideonella livida]NDY90752.1 leucyl/phenylalanyl-tRNA--protein transferase [Ideonella livida]
MPLTWLQPQDPFPPTALALDEATDAPGLLAVGADLSADRLVQAYRRGIFPWYAQGQPILWWTPHPRMVLPVAEFKLSRSLKRAVRQGLASGRLEVRLDLHFDRVIQACAQTPRHGQAGTWILPEMVRAYQRLHGLGVAHSVETWQDGQLVGGLYGLMIGRMFFGESMFAHATDASKMALCALVALCREDQIELIDCQQETAHLASLGARPIRRAQFEAHLARTVDLPTPRWSDRTVPWHQLGLNTAQAPVENDA